MPRAKRDTGTGQGPLEKELHTIGRDEFLAAMEVFADHVILKCLVPGCGFEISTRWTSVRDVILNLRADYRLHRSLRHEEYRGKTRYHVIVDRGAAGWRPSSENQS